MKFAPGELVRLPGQSEYLTVDDLREVDGGARLYLVDKLGTIQRVDLTADEVQAVEVLRQDGEADPKRVLAGLWTSWMKAASIDAKASALATTPLRPYLHQTNAVYGVMLPQPQLRFLLADEPGTGKTIMAGMLIREMQRLGLVRRVLVVVPAHLVPKWQQDFERFFGGGLKRIWSYTAQEGPLRPDQDLWIVSLDLAAANPQVQEVIRQESAGWDLAVFDEAHRLTPTAQSYYRLGRAVCLRSPRVLLMTATPHRGKEGLFRALMHLVDPAVFPEVSDVNEAHGARLRPGSLHFLRRMKEDLVDYDGVTPLFKGRRAENEAVPLNALELGFYNQALEMVANYFPPAAVPLASIVYGKRAASSLYALAETLKRRRDLMGTENPAFVGAEEDEFDPAAEDERRILVETSRAATAERKAIAQMLHQLQPLLDDPDMSVSKWPRMLDECLLPNGIKPGGTDQLVVFTEYSDTADWLVKRFRNVGFSCEQYSGHIRHEQRDAIRAGFARGEFQVIVSTDAGNEGIDLQTANVLVNWDIPWSLVRLEQRMGRIHRVGQMSNVVLYNLVATGAREGHVLATLLGNFVSAANALGGQVFDSLSLVAELADLDADKLDRLLRDTYAGDPVRVQQALEAVRAVTAARLKSAAQKAAEEENALKSKVDVASAVAELQEQSLERINPSIVEAYLQRLSETGAYSVAKHASDGMFVLARPTGSLPEALGGSSRALVASSGDAIKRAVATGADVSRAVSLGPSELAFRQLIDKAGLEFASAILRGGSLADPASVTDYDLLAFEAMASEVGGSRKTVWFTLVKVDATGARAVRWESLANLRAQPDAICKGIMHPAHASDAQSAAENANAERLNAYRKAMTEWLSEAKRTLEHLPLELSAQIEDQDRRRELRKHLEGAIAVRLQELRRIADINVDPAKRLGWTHVLAAGVPEAAEEKHSEVIAMKLTTDRLRAAGWSVSDVHKEGRGYDLLAKRGPVQRCAECKGVWASATSSGVRMPGNEILVARQLGDDYWLYVVDDCANGGKVFAEFQNPAALFADEMKELTVIQLPGSALKAARDREKGA